MHPQPVTNPDAFFGAIRIGRPFTKRPCGVPPSIVMDCHRVLKRYRIAKQLECIQKYIRVDRKEISFLRFIFEAYGGIATLTTVDAAKGLVVMQIPPGCQDTAQSVLDDLSTQLLIEPNNET